MYKSLDPGVRVVILKALCDIRVEVLLLSNVSVAVVLFFTPLLVERLNFRMVE